MFIINRHRRKAPMHPDTVFCNAQPTLTNQVVKLKKKLVQC